MHIASLGLTRFTGIITYTDGSSKSNGLEFDRILFVGYSERINVNFAGLRIAPLHISKGALGFLPAHSNPDCNAYVVLVVCLLLLYILRWNTLH